MVDGMEKNFMRTIIVRCNYDQERTMLFVFQLCGWSWETYGVKRNFLMEQSKIGSRNGTCAKNYVFKMFVQLSRIFFLNSIFPTCLFMWKIILLIIHKVTKLHKSLCIAYNSNWLWRRLYNTQFFLATWSIYARHVQEQKIKSGY